MKLLIPLVASKDNLDFLGPIKSPDEVPLNMHYSQGLDLNGIFNYYFGEVNEQHQ